MWACYDFWMMKHSLLLTTLAFAAATLACGLPSFASPTQPASPIPVSATSAHEVTDLLEAAATSAATGAVTVTFTEQQLTSAVALYLEDHPTEPSLTNPQVFLRDGKIQLYGTTDVQGMAVNATFVIVPELSSDGQLRFTAESGTFGPMGVPDEILAQITDTLNEWATGSIAPSLTGVRLSNVVVADGELTVTGTK
jgi:uncharacterized protein YpmS